MTGIYDITFENPKDILNDGEIEVEISMSHRQNQIGIYNATKQKYGDIIRITAFYLKEVRYGDLSDLK